MIATAFLALAAALLAFGLWMGTNARTGPQATMGTALAFIGGIIMLILLAMAIPAHARDLGQWENADPAVREWYQHLMQPDVPTMSCCGEADLYWCDDIHVRNEKTFCRITDDRPDEPRGRPHLDIGTEFEIPTNKLKYDRGNPSNHALLFVSRNGYVFCFVQPGGV